MIKPKNRKAPAATEAIPNETGQEILPQPMPNCKEYATAAELAELHGGQLTRVHRVGSPAVMYRITSAIGTQSVGHWHDVLGILAAWGERI